MNLPKYVPGQVVVTDSNQMGIIEYAWDMGTGNLTYRLNTGAHFEESSFKYILNGKIWLPVERYNPPQTPENQPLTIIPADDPDEAAWLAENLVPRTRKIEVTDGDE